MTRAIVPFAEAVIGDVLSALIKDLPGANTLQAIAGIALDKMLAARDEQARKIFLDEIAKAKRPIEEVQGEDEFVQIYYRYKEASRQGAARLNLRLLAKVIRGQYERAEMRADQFLRLASMLESLTEEEVVFLATLHRHFNEKKGEDFTKIYSRVVDILAGKFKVTATEVYTTALALLRTGLILPHFNAVGGATGAFYCEPSPLLARVAELASFEEALQESEAEG